MLFFIIMTWMSHLISLVLNSFTCKMGYEGGLCESNVIMCVTLIGRPSFRHVCAEVCGGEKTVIAATTPTLAIQSFNKCS